MLLEAYNIKIFLFHHKNNYIFFIKIVYVQLNAVLSLCQCMSQLSMNKTIIT